MSRTINLTDIAIKQAIVAVSDGQTIVLKEPGENGGDTLVLVCRAGGATWHRVSSADGRRRSKPIGTYPETSLGQARLALRNQSRPYLLTSTTVTEDLSLGRLGRVYLDALRAQGKKSAGRMWWYFFGGGGLIDAIGHEKPAAEVTTQDIRAHLATIHARGKRTLAKDTRAHAHSMFAFGIKSENDYTHPGGGLKWGITANPVTAIGKDKGASPPRDRYLDLPEIVEFWDWCTDLEWNRRYRCVHALKLCLITGQRPGEIVTLTKDRYNSRERAAAWEDTKNGQPHFIPLAHQAVEILDKLEPNEHGLYFWRREYPDEPFDVNLLGATVRRMIEQTGMKPFETRDLRRTWTTLAGAAGLSLEIRDRIQNHGIPGVTSRHYDKYGYWREKRAATDVWASALDWILQNGADGSVHELQDYIDGQMSVAPEYLQITKVEKLA